MIPRERPSCYVIGSESLLVQCSEILLREGFEIHGVVSAEPAIREWAESKGLARFELGAGLPGELRARPFDYLFSIANLAILPQDLLELPRKGAINFHDGPLPRYAGLHATSWAILRRERTHGVTWHFIEGGVDKGRMLKQEMFDISADETALTLNVKCYEAGIRTFGVLALELSQGTSQPREQALAERTYFGASQRPEGACVIRWEKPAQEIAALVRALDFGPYPNPLGLPKTILGERVFAVGACSILPRASGSTPGSVTAIDDGAITVATAGEDLRFEKLFTLEGLPARPESLGIARGARLRSLDESASRRATLLHEDICRHESFWARRLEALAPAEIPYARADRADGAAHARSAFARELPRGAAASICARAPGSTPGDAVCAAICALLARATGSRRLDVGYSEPAIREATKGLEPLFASVAPLRAEVRAGEPFEAFARSIASALEQARSRKTFPRDLAGRQPRLRAAAEKLAASGWPVVLEQVEKLPALDAAPAPADGVLQVFVARDGSACLWSFDAEALGAAGVEALARQLATLLEAAAAQPDLPIEKLPLISAPERRKVTIDWNDTRADYPRDRCIHDIFEAQAARTPRAVAAAFRDQQVTYAELNERANRLARHLRGAGVGPETLVGICMERSIDMLVGLLGVLKAGGAYVPLDPGYPAERLRFMLDDSKVLVLLTQARLRSKLPEHRSRTICVDAGPDREAIERESPERVESGATPSSLAYAIYTSGSTGTPKGVLVEHRNVVNFFAGMDQRIAHDPPGVWLAVTSLSFDISVLELLWTLARGFKVVIHGERGRTHAATAASATTTAPSRLAGAAALEMSLFYFASDESQAGRDKYRLLLEGARFADKNGFTAVWTPERHFHAFGGLYPSPSVASAAIAAVTERVKIRAGSVVLPLHHPIRVAEEWSLVDNLSNGRVGISFASGWHPDDFVLRPESHAEAKKIMMRDLEVVRRLWRGERVRFPGPNGREVEVGTLPRPVQPELPFWITTAGNPETFRMAGEAGANVLTHLLGQTLDELEAKLEVYRKAWKQAGHGPGRGHVTIMLHTFVGEDDAAVRETVRKPMMDYLRSSANLIRQHASAFPAFKKRVESGSGADEAFKNLSADDLDALVAYSFERYYETSGLFGTPETCAKMLAKLALIGVDELACLIDFGVDADAVLASLEHLNTLRERTAEGGGPEAGASIAEEIARHDVTHLQCTPSMAGMLAADRDTRAALGSLKSLLVGGEALPASLAADLSTVVRGTVTNLYGPTETTVWSSTHAVDGERDSIPIGKPIANTQLYILDASLEPVPPGAPGELFIGGDGVARGYRDRPELTAERFLANPFGPPGSRIYRTGDLARHRADGSVEFLGRIDHQVKIRGYRIELGEIEEILRRHPSVREAVVVAREDVPGDKRLVAYFSPRERGTLQADELKQRLKERLPEFMVPAHFVELASLPLTPNGKVDRKALRPPEEKLETAGAAPAPPASALESTIAAIWMSVLNTQRVGVEDNFFDLGGHSLLTVQVLAKVREATGRNLPITDMFRFPTVRSLARYLAQGEASEPTLDDSEQRGAARRALLERRRK